MFLARWLNIDNEYVSFYFKIPSTKAFKNGSIKPIKKVDPIQLSIRLDWTGFDKYIESNSIAIFQNRPIIGLNEA